MKKLIGWLAVVLLLILLVQWHGILRGVSPKFISFNSLWSMQNTTKAAPPNAEDAKHIDGAAFNLFQCKFFSKYKSLRTWNHMKHVLTYSHGLPNALEAIKEANVAWNSLIFSNDVMTSSVHSLKNAATKHDETDYRLKIPWGLVQGYSITIIGKPNSNLGNFQIDLIGKSGVEEQVSPIFHYYVRLQGNRKTNESIIVGNSWTAGHDAGDEHRCPSSSITNNEKADNTTCIMKVVNHFAFRHGYISVMTVKMDEEWIKMTVDGRHITSFPRPESLNPWLVTEVKISGGFKLIYSLANGLRMSEDAEHLVDFNFSRDVPTETKNELDLFVGILSMADNFNRRMAIRRTWMQYPAVKSGMVAVRFFVGLHENQLVNEALWKEANTYGDIQLMPWIDYYNLIPMKTVAICIFGSQFVSAKYIMKTDDDAFVRIDQVLASLNKANVTRGLLYGLINFNSHPDRDNKSKWYLSPQEWPNSDYPPWAHGPGYVITRDIAMEINRRHKHGTLKMFKLEDVAMGIWIEEMKKQGMEIHYITESNKRINYLGCAKDYIVAHYQRPKQLLCLWEKLHKYNEAECCS